MPGLGREAVERLAAALQEGEGGEGVEPEREEGLPRPAEGGEQ